MGLKKVLEAKKIPEWLAVLTNSYSVFAPHKAGRVAEFRQFDTQGEIDLERFSVTSVKEALFPAVHTLFAYTFEKEEPTHTSVLLEAAVQSQKQVVFGARPCDARGLFTFDTVLGADRYRDPHFTALRADTHLVTIACHRPANTCFCTSVGGGPAEHEGADILLTELDGSYLAESFKDADTLLEGPFFRKASPAEIEQAKHKNQEAGSKLRAVNTSGRPQEALLNIFGSDYWRDKAAKCLSCGACTYLCPTCYCFNMTDEGQRTGARVRTWDSCMFPMFTQEASGHNPRPQKAQRLRNRINHKFSYFPSRYNMLSCVGCGRCIRHCPVGVDIREIVAGAQEA